MTNLIDIINDINSTYNDNYNCLEECNFLTLATWINGKYDIATNTKELGELYDKINA